MVRVVVEEQLVVLKKIEEMVLFFIQASDQLREISILWNWLFTFHVEIFSVWTSQWRVKKIEKMET